MRLTYLTVITLALLIILNFNIFNIVFVKADNLSGIIINEVMYDPLDNDNYHEWVELYNPTNRSINVSGWSIQDNAQTDTIEGNSNHGNGTTLIPPYSYALITDKGTNLYNNTPVPHNAIRLYIDDRSIGNGLSNTRDHLILTNSQGIISDTLEWGYNYPEIPGQPAAGIPEGHSLARYPNTDTNSSQNDFYECSKPTPGSHNQVSTLNLKQYPRYIPKIYDHEEYSIPFCIQLTLANLHENTSYTIKSYIVGKTNNIYPASQTWNGTHWQYSFYYTHNITTDPQGNHTLWIPLRFNKAYQEYQNNIQNNSHAYLHVKIHRKNTTLQLSKRLKLLDLDNSTKNGTPGGCIIGQIPTTYQSTLTNGTVAQAINNTGTTTGIYPLNTNHINEYNNPPLGYYKIPSPLDSGYQLQVFTKNNTILFTQSNITVKQGSYNHQFLLPTTTFYHPKHQPSEIPLTLKNTGDFSDTLTLTHTDISSFHCTFTPENFTFNPEELYTCTLTIHPEHKVTKPLHTIDIITASTHDPNINLHQQIQLILTNPDLLITNLTIPKYADKHLVFGEGELVPIKAHVKNQGINNASDVTISFYLDQISQKHHIGSKTYESISSHHKYPKIIWDTTGVTPGIHTIYVVVDPSNIIKELNDKNNTRAIQIHIQQTTPNHAAKKIKIMECYYHTYPNIHNEYLSIKNPTTQTIDISGWHLTNTPHKNKDSQTKLIFPNNTVLPAKTAVTLTQNACDYFNQTGMQPDFEYATNSDQSVPQMISSTRFTLSNNGESIALKDLYNHTIDCLTYGETPTDNTTGWQGTPAPVCGCGAILKRKQNMNHQPCDTNTSEDWIHPRRYGIGQSEFILPTLSAQGKITMFVSPDCSFTVIQQAIQNASESIYLNMYEFTDPFLYEELLDALQRDICVTLFLEGSPIGGIDEREQVILQKITNAGGHVRLIMNLPEEHIYARYTFDHGKYLIIDNETVIVESCNWVKTGIPQDPSFGNREWGILVTNESVAATFKQVFLDDYNPNRCDSIKYSDLAYSFPQGYYLDKSVYSGLYQPTFTDETITGTFNVTPVFSPDNSLSAVLNLLDSAQRSIYIQQLYIYPEWGDVINPLVEKLINKSQTGVDIKVILNYNPAYEASNSNCNITKELLENAGVQVKYLFTNWSYFTNVHNKGVIVDNTSVLISSINWNENSFIRNREVGVIIENEEVASFYAEVFLYDWALQPFESRAEESGVSLAEYKNQVVIVSIYTLTFGLIARDWRKRKWIS